MATSSKKENIVDIRKRLSIELCDNFTRRLNQAQSKEIKIDALISIRNLIKETQISDPIIYSLLVDTIIDPDKEIRDWVFKITKEVVNKEIIELLEIKLLEVTGGIKNEIEELIKLSGR